MLNGINRFTVFPRGHLDGSAGTAWAQVSVSLSPAVQARDVLRACVLSVDKRGKHKPIADPVRNGTVAVLVHVMS